MGRTKWKNRTPEDKQRILDEQKKMGEKKKPKWHQENDDKAMAIYRSNAFPIRCMQHGWVEPWDYEIRDGKDPLGQKRVFIVGVCPDCLCVVSFSKTAYYINVNGMILSERDCVTDHHISIYDIEEFLTDKKMHFDDKLDIKEYLGEIKVVKLMRKAWSES